MLLHNTVKKSIVSSILRGQFLKQKSKTVSIKHHRNSQRHYKGSTKGAKLWGSWSQVKCFIITEQIPRTCEQCSKVHAWHFSQGLNQILGEYWCLCTHGLCAWSEVERAWSTHAPFKCVQVKLWYAFTQFALLSNLPLCRREAAVTLGTDAIVGKAGKGRCQLDSIAGEAVLPT